MSSRKPPVWKKPKSKIYDYNYNLGEHYYKPQIRHMDDKYGQNKEASPPRARTFAERFAADPIYGSNSGLNYRTTAERPYESTSSSSGALPQRRTSLQDDLMGSFGRKPLFESSRGYTPEDDDFRPSRPRINFGERLLDAAGAGGFGSRQGIFGELGGSAQVQEDPFDDPFFASRKKLLPPRSADPDFMTEDPFKKTRFGSVSRMEDDDDKLVSDFKRDSDSVVAGFRSRMQARRQREEESTNSNEIESSGIESRVDKIRARAKARMAELEDDLPALTLRSSDSANRARALLRDIDDMDSSSMGLSSSGLSSSVGSSSKTLRITKRTIKATVETD